MEPVELLQSSITNARVVERFQVVRKIVVLIPNAFYVSSHSGWCTMLEWEEWGGSLCNRRKREGGKRERRDVAYLGQSKSRLGPVCGDERRRSLEY